ncbi:hypothetical protein EG833_02280, partial [archaeon]|nr:hypothetical protein [archaeon]
MHHRSSALLLSCLIFILSACGGAGKDHDATTGSISFSLQTPASGTSPSTKAPVLNCELYGVTSVEAYVYDGNNELLGQGGPWTCTVGEGIIPGIMAGTNRSVRVYLRNDRQQVVLTGSRSGIAVISGQITDVGDIQL